MALYLGIDMGTTGLKAILARPDGTIAGSGYREYPISIPSRGFAEQDSEDWWRALKDALAEATAQAPGEEIVGIGLSGQMHGTVLLDGEGRMLAPAVIWCDQRSAAQAQRVRDALGADTLGRWTQNPVSTGFQLSTLLWFRENRPDLYDRIRHVLLPKDYLRLRLTGLYGTEPTDACSTLMFDCARRDWSREMLAAMEIDRAILPEVGCSPMQIQGALTADAARELGLRPGIPVAYGGGDQPMQAVGNGILTPGDASVTLGTGGQVFVPSSTPAYDPKLRTHTFCHAPQDMWYVMGATLNACLAQNWLMDKVLGTHDFAGMHQLAAQVPPGSDGLIFLPYLTGERTPLMDPHARGAFIGLTLNHDRATMVRAAIEGISFALLDAMECIREQGLEIHRLILSGGGARSPLWRQIIADMFDCPIHTTAMREEAGIGAAICAMVGAGEYANLEEACHAIVRLNDNPTLPVPRNVALYRERHAAFLRAIPVANC